LETKYFFVLEQNSYTPLNCRSGAFSFRILHFILHYFASKTCRIDKIMDCFRDETECPRDCYK